MTRLIDLHTHSKESDGSLTPTELIKIAKEKGLSAIALTDHDTIAGLGEAKEAGKRFDIEVISGIEFSTSYGDYDIHILGLLIDEENSYFANTLDEIIQSRNVRNVKMVDRLNELGISITLEDIRAASKNRVVTRAHFATVLYHKGYVSSYHEAFEKYIGTNCPAYIPREKLPPKRSIEMIKMAGGVPILAHPTLYGLDNKGMESLVQKLIADGIEGIEGIYPLYSQEEERYVQYLAHQYNLVISGGSDFHGDVKPDLEIGTGYGNLLVPYSLLEEIKLRR